MLDIAQQCLYGFFFFLSWVLEFMLQLLSQNCKRSVMAGRNETFCNLKMRPQEQRKKSKNCCFPPSLLPVVICLSIYIYKAYWPKHHILYTVNKSFCTEGQMTRIWGGLIAKIPTLTKDWKGEVRKIIWTSRFFKQLTLPLWKIQTQSKNYEFH